jgi:hypothetical protein
MDELSSSSHLSHQKPFLAGGTSNVKIEEECDFEISNLYAGRDFCAWVDECSGCTG